MGDNNCTKVTREEMEVYYFKFLYYILSGIMSLEWRLYQFKDVYYKP